MKPMIPLQKVWDKVDAMSKNCVDALIPVPEISFLNMENVIISGKSHPLRNIAQRSICYRLGVPQQYLRKCPEDVQAYNLNHWIAKEKNNEMFFRFDGEDVRAVFTPKYSPVDNFEVLNQLDQLGYTPETEVQCQIDGEMMMLNIPDPSGEFVVMGNDRMRPGLSISNSEVGLAALCISAFILRLVCTNGMITKESHDNSYRHISSKILERFPEVLSGIASQLVQQQNRLRISAESKVAHPFATMDSFNRQFLLNDVEKLAVVWAWPFEQGDTMFNVMNTYTKAAQYDELTTESAYRLQKVGGSILALVQ